MTWQEFSVARQFLAEERVGKALRAAKRNEDAKAARSIKAGKKRA